jgi:hypothetical protein
MVQGRDLLAVSLIGRLHARAATSDAQLTLVSSFVHRKRRECCASSALAHSAI